MKTGIHEMVATDRTVFALRHLETSEYICLRHQGDEFMACFSAGDSARQFRQELGLVEFVDVSALHIGEAPFDHFWLDGNMIGRKMLTPSEALVARP